MELAFRIYNNGDQLVLVSFPENGGEAVLRKSWSLNSLAFNSDFVPDRRNMPYGEHKIPRRKSLVRGGFSVKIDYKKQLIRVTPRNRQSNELQSKTVNYKFEDLGLEHNPEEDPFSRDKRELIATLDQLPLKKD